MRISDWSSDVCSSDLVDLPEPVGPVTNTMPRGISEMSLKIAGHFKSSSDSIFDGIVRNTAAAPREVLHALTRKRQLGRATCRERVMQDVSLSVGSVR